MVHAPAVPQLIEESGVMLFICVSALSWVGKCLNIYGYSSAQNMEIGNNFQELITVRLYNYIQTVCLWGRIPPLRVPNWTQVVSTFLCRPPFFTQHYRRCGTDTCMCAYKPHIKYVMPIGTKGWRLWITTESRNARVRFSWFKNYNQQSTYIISK